MRRLMGTVHHLSGAMYPRPFWRCWVQSCFAALKSFQLNGTRHRHHELTEVGPEIQTGLRLRLSRPENDITRHQSNGLVTVVQGDFVTHV